MRKALFIGVCIVVLAGISCKRVCYNCTQYCAYCQLSSDTTTVTKICALQSRGTANVNKAVIALRDSGYTCNIKDDISTVCDGKRSIDEALLYHQKQDYYCEPRD